MKDGSIPGRFKEIGVPVTCGDQIGEIGNTGCSISIGPSGTGEHLHLQIERSYSAAAGPFEILADSSPDAKVAAKTLNPVVVLHDGDSDGASPIFGDCNDANASVHPRATENCSNTIDDDCNGDVDGDDSACTPAGITTLVTGLSNPNDLAVDSTDVFWIEAGSGLVRKVRKSDQVITPLATGEISLSGLALDSIFVYFGSGTNDASTVKKVAKTGGTVTPIAVGEHSVVGVAVSGSDVFWTDFAGLGYGQGLIRKGSTSGSSPVTLAGGTYYPGGITVAGSYVLWAELNNPGRVMKVPVTVGGASELVANNSNTVGIASDGVNVFWAESISTNAGRINKVLIGGGGVIALATGLSAPWDVAIDNTNVYWVESNGCGGVNTNGAVKKVAKGGGTPIVLASGLSCPVGIAVDATSVYWIERATGGTNGTLNKIAIAP